MKKKTKTKVKNPLFYHMFILFGYSSSIQLYFKIINFSVKPESLTCTYALKGTIYILTIYNNLKKKISTHHKQK